MTDETTAHRAIDAIGERVEKLGTADHIMAWDRKQAGRTQEQIDDRKRVIARDLEHVDVEIEALLTDGQKAILEELLVLDEVTPARVCGANAKHGRLQVHGSGINLICCVARPAPCPYVEPISR